MQITDAMNLDQLAERMGSVATQADAAAMRDLLVSRFDGQDTSGIPEAEWLAMLDQVPPSAEAAMVFTDTLKVFSIRQAVKTPEGKGVIQEIRDCEYPIFVRFPDGRVNAFTQREVETITPTITEPMANLLKAMGHGRGWDELGAHGPLSHAARVRTCEALSRRGLLAYSCGDYGLTDAGEALARHLNSQPAK